MSKAFLRESDVETEPTMARAAVVAPGAKHYLTASGAEKLRGELTRLRDTERPALAAAATDPETKRELRVLDERVRFLQQLLSTAEVVTPSSSESDVVRFGARVTVREESDDVAAYQIVGVEETDFFEGGISFLSPLAQALLRAHLGDRVRFQTPAGPRELEILRVEY